MSDRHPTGPDPARLLDPATLLDPAPLLDPATWSCPVPLREGAVVVMGHGAGGALSAELIDDVVVPALAPDPGAVLRSLGDAAVVDVGGATVAISTDSFVVRPLAFPGGSIGDLAVNGTVNDLAMAGAQPLYLTCALILEEGTGLDVVERVLADLGAAARRAGVSVVTGDTKVVESGHGDGIYVNTTGVGLVAPGVRIGPQQARPDDVVIVSGPIGDHGVAVLSVRDGLLFDTQVRSDTAPLHGLVAAMLATGAEIHTLRDPTRGGLAATLNEIARSSDVGIEIDEPAVPVRPAVASACAMLGLDPWSVANEGRLVAFVPAAAAEDVLDAMRAHPLGAGAVAVGRCLDRHRGTVVARTALGTTRIVDLPQGEQLPRIC